MEFNVLRDQLVMDGLTFDATTLQLLEFQDLVRAGIGDAGSAICGMELVRAERDARIRKEAQRIRDAAGPMVLVPASDAALYRAALQHLHQRPATAPTMDSLSTVTQTYVLLRCLRGHTDSPMPRMVKLHSLLSEMSTQESVPYRLRASALVLSHMIHQWIEKGQDDLNLERFRHDTFNLYHLVRSHIPTEEQAIKAHLEVADYHCTFGCFSPGAQE